MNTKMHTKMHTHMHTQRAMQRTRQIMSHVPRFPRALRPFAGSALLAGALAMAVVSTLALGTSVAHGAPSHPATAQASQMTRMAQVLTRPNQFPYDEAAPWVSARSPAPTCVHLSRTRYLVLYSLGTTVHLSPAYRVTRYRLGTDVLGDSTGNVVGRHLAAALVRVAPVTVPAC